MSTFSDASPDGRDSAESIDLNAIESDLAGVEQALDRLEDGTYWTDEVTGQPIDPAHLDRNPTARRNPS